MGKNFVDSMIHWAKKHQNLVSITLIVVVGLVAFIPSMKNAGFFGDDYYLLLGGAAFGPNKFIEMYASDRPTLGYTYDAVFRLLGTNIHFYQAFVLFFNILTSLTVYALVRKLWRQQKLLALAAGVLFCIYPGFIDHMHAFLYAIFLLTIFASMFSVYLTAQAVSADKRIIRWSLTLLAMGFQLWGVLNLEYYLGLEVLRLAVIYIMIRNRPSAPTVKHALWETAKAYIPYLLVAAGFFAWRFFLFHSVRSATNLGIYVRELAASPLYKLVSIAAEWLTYALNVTVFSWFVSVYTQLTTLRLKALLIFALVAVAAGGLAFLILKALEKDEDAEFVRGKTLQQMILIGLATLVGVGLPIVFVDRQATLGAFSRYTLPAMFGGILLVLGFAFALLTPRLRSVVIAALVAGGVFVQLGVGNGIGETWSVVENTWWQISWRIPSLKPGTVLTGKLAGISLAEGYYLWGPANLIYTPHPQSSFLPIGAEIIYPDFIQSILTGQNTDIEHRSFTMTLDPQHLLVLSRPTDASCVHVIDSAMPGLLMDGAPDIQLLSSYSHIDQIDVNAAPAVPQQVIFGAEPPHDWCYYYEKASLALQKGDYAQVAALGSEVDQKQLSAGDTTEWLPFVLSYAETGNISALDKVLPMYLEQKFTQQTFCANLANNLYPLSDAARAALKNAACQ